MRYFKLSRNLILTRYAKLKDKNKKACDLMLLYNLRLAYYLKECILNAFIYKYTYGPI